LRGLILRKRGQDVDWIALLLIAAPAMGGLGGVALGIVLSAQFIVAGNALVASMGAVMAFEGGLVALLAFPKFRTRNFIQRFVPLAASAPVVVLLGFLYGAGNLFSPAGFAVVGLLAMLAFLVARTLARFGDRTRP